jgi:serine/threonine protein kinase
MMQSGVRPTMEGQVIAGKYQLMRLLGQGGMGAVYEGRNVQTYKRCAVKLLLYPEFSNNSDLVKRFFREARAGSAIESDHIVEVYDSGSDPVTGWPYMVMECLQGEDLEHLMKRLGPIEPAAAAKMVLQAAIGLARAHEAGIVHRDIKPANLYLTQRDSGDLSIKILDFGVAKVKMENFHETSTGLTRTGSMLGTPLYMSPEQCKGASTIDARSDVWSLGIVLWELLSGGSPFSNATSLGGLMASIITEELPLLQDRAPWVPAELAEVVHRAMSRDVTKRYQTAGELRDALSSFVGGAATLFPQMLQPVSEEQRATAAERLVLTDDGMLRATARTGVTLSQTGSREKKRSLLPYVLLGVAACAALGAGLVWKMREGAAPAATVAEAPKPVTPAPPPVVTVVQVAPAVTRKASLAVKPAGVEVKVDGVAAAVSGGRVELEGPVGTTRKVELSFEGRSETRVVAIAESGLVPDELELTAAPAPATAPKSARSTKTASPGRAATAATTPKPEKKKATGLDEGTGEFK